MKLNEIMNREVIQASPEETISDAARRMREKVVGCLVVTVGATVKGIITDRDLLVCLSHGHDPYRCNIAEHMHRPVIVLGPDEDHATAATVMRRRRIKRLPIAESGRLLGIVSLSDLAALAEKTGEELRAALDFFASVVGAHSAQSSGLRPSPAAVVQDAAALQPEAGENRSEMIDVGGPG
jgi:CBS domain-containing protein